MSFSRALSTFVKNASASFAKQQRFSSTLSVANASSLYKSPVSSQHNRGCTTLLKSSEFSRRCAAALHTEGDRRFVELLESEIQQEKDRSLSMTSMSDGWQASFDGASGTLKKSHDGDKIEVQFSLNGSIPPLQEEDIEHGEEEEGALMPSYPEFTVKVTKPNTRQAIELECFFPEDVQDGIQEDEDTNLFSIRSVIVYEGEISEGTYIIETDNLEPKVYSYLLSYLADRGVDNQFAEEFIELTTAAEQKEYVVSLQKLKDFISSK